MELKMLNVRAEIAQSANVRTSAKHLRHSIALTSNGALVSAAAAFFVKRFPMVWSVHKLQTALLYKISFIQALTSRWSHYLYLISLHN